MFGFGVVWRLVNFWIVFWNFYGLVLRMVMGVCCEGCCCCFGDGFVGLRDFDGELKFFEVVGVVLVGLFIDCWV